MENGMRRNH